MSTVVELELTSETPVFLGSYDAQFHEWDAFRTQSLKGLCRWWLRAYVAGILYDHGLLSRVDGKAVDTISNLTGRLLGSTREASRLRVVASVRRVGRRRECPGYDSPCKLPRVRLLTLGHRTASYTDSLSVTLRIEERLGSRRLSDDEALLSIGSLLTGIALSGLGKMSRRGLGTFSVRVLRDHRGLLRRYVRADGTLNLDRLGDLLRDVREACRRYASSDLRGRGSPPSDIPPMDLISDRLVDVSSLKLDLRDVERPEILRGGGLCVFAVYEIRWTGKSIIDVLDDLQSFFYRPGRIRKYYGGSSTPYGRWQDLVTVSKSSWILGLPRTQRGTGYIADVDRRASPVILSVHRDRAYCTIFVSKDWPSMIDWSGAGSRRIGVTRDLIVRTFVEVTGYMQSYLRKLGYSYRVVFP